MLAVDKKKSQTSVGTVPNTYTVQFKKNFFENVFGRTYIPTYTFEMDNFSKIKYKKYNKNKYPYSWILGYPFFLSSMDLLILALFEFFWQFFAKNIPG